MAHCSSTGLHRCYGQQAWYLYIHLLPWVKRHAFCVQTDHSRETHRFHPGYVVYKIYIYGLLLLLLRL